MRREKVTTVALQTLRYCRNKMCAIEVFKCLNGLSPFDNEKYFKRLDHCKGTRGNDPSLLLPKVKSEAGRKTFAFWVLRF